MSNASSYFKLNGRPSIIHRSWILILEHDSDEEFEFLKQFFLQQYTPANLNFCCLFKPFFMVPNSLVNTWLKKGSFTVAVTTQAFPMWNHLC